MDLLQYSVWVFDCDGVLWRDGAVIRGAVDLIRTLRQLEKRILFVTNNSTLSRLQYLNKFTCLGFPEPRKEDIISSGFLCARLLQQRRSSSIPRALVYVIGESGLHCELRSAGFTTLGEEDKNQAYTASKFLNKYLSDRRENNIAAVVVGMDSRINMYKIAYASQCVQDGAYFIATNSDPQLPSSRGLGTPGAGAIVAAVSMAAGKQPDVICGKPNSLGIRSYLEEHNIQVSPVSSIVIGDRLSTDIALGKSMGCSTIWVQTGSERLENGFGTDRHLDPTYIFSSVYEINQSLAIIPSI